MYYPGVDGGAGYFVTYPSYIPVGFISAVVDRDPGLVGNYGFLLGSTTSYYYWHSLSNFLYNGGYCASPVCQTGSYAWMNGRYYSPGVSTPYPGNTVNVIGVLTSINSSLTNFNAIGTDRTITHNFNGYYMEVVLYSGYPTSADQVTLYNSQSNYWRTPLNATNLSWSQTSPTGTTALTASWNASTSPTLTDQKIQFYADAVCSTTSGSLIDLASATTSTRAFTGTTTGTYSY